MTTAATTAAMTTERGADGIVVITLDAPGEKVNTLSRALMEGFQGLLADAESNTGITGIVLRSGKPDNFVAGADIKDFLTIQSALEGETMSRAGHALLDRVEALPVPVVVAIHGSCLGGGLELALACHYRVASDDPKTVLGLPEVRLGLLPGAGGTQRLPRLIGLQKSLDMILTGRSLKAARALKAGLVDEVAPASVLLDVARKAVLRLVAGTLSPRRPGIPLSERLLRPIIFSKARKSVLERTGGHYPAPLEAIEVVRKGTATTLSEGLRLEAQAFGKLAVTDVSRALVSVFFATQEIKKDAGYPEGTKATEVTKLAVLGAGVMGAGIAGVSADAGVAIRMKDASHESLGRGFRYVREALEERRKRGSLSRLELEKRMDRLAGTIDYSGFRRAELVIEAVFEDVEVKRKVLAEAEAATTESCVFASNTSSIPISEIATASSRPSQVLGMHFFWPVFRSLLLEVIVTPETGPEALATAVSFGRRIGKNVIVVRDGPGFYTTRAITSYMNEAARLLEEGATIPAVDEAMLAFGFPMGPIALLDEVGMDVGAKVAKVMYRHFGDRMAPPPSMAKLLEDGRLGRKSKRGFYTYDGKKKRVDETVYALLPAGSARRPFEARDIQDRLVFAFLNESALCLQDGILRSPRDGDMGAIYGFGFPPFLGGPFRYLDHIGARFAVQVLEKLAAQHGERFRPAQVLQDLAREGWTFHGPRKG